MAATSCAEGGKLLEFNLQQIMYRTFEEPKQSTRLGTLKAVTTHVKSITDVCQHDPTVCPGLSGIFALGCSRMCVWRVSGTIMDMYRDMGFDPAEVTRSG